MHGGSVPLKGALHLRLVLATKLSATMPSYANTAHEGSVLLDAAFRLRLVPDAAYLIRVHYWAYPAVLTADGDTNPLLTRQRKLLELGVTARALLHYGEDAKAQLWIQLWDREYAKAINNDRRRMAVSNGTFRISTVAGRPAAGRRGTLNPFRQTPYGWM